MSKDYSDKIMNVLIDHFNDKCNPVSGLSKECRFYLNRFLVLYHYPLTQARELVKMICRCAFNDSQLTDYESICIIETCLDPQLDNILLEVNYNACW